MRGTRRIARFDSCCIQAEDSCSAVVVALIKDKRGPGISSGGSEIPYGTIRVKRPVESGFSTF